MEGGTLYSVSITSFQGSNGTLHISIHHQAGRQILFNSMEKGKKDYPSQEFTFWEFLSSPVVELHAFTAKGIRLIPGQEVKIQQATQLSQKQTNKLSVNWGINKPLYKEKLTVKFTFFTHKWISKKSDQTTVELFLFRSKPTLKILDHLVVIEQFLWIY